MDEYTPSAYSIVKRVEDRIAEGKGSPHGGVYGQANLSQVISAVRLLVRQGLDVNKFEHYWTLLYDYGGLVINERAETTIPGLYACGEIAANMGAGYLPFRMFSHCIVTGRWAGQYAAGRAKKIRQGKIQQEQVGQEYVRVYDILNKTPRDPVTVHEARQQIQETATKGCGPWRNRKKAQEALGEFQGIKREVLPRIYVRDKSRLCNMEWKEALEAWNMVVCAEMVTRAALMRTESRGPHVREDYPYTDNDNWLRNIYIKQVDSEMRVTTRPIVVTKVKPPSGKVWPER